MAKNGNITTVFYATEEECDGYYEVIWNPGVLSNAKYKFGKLVVKEGEINNRDATFFDTVSIITRPLLLAERECKKSGGGCSMQQSHYLEFYVDGSDTVIAVVINNELLEQIICTCATDDITISSNGITSHQEFDKIRNELIAKTNKEHNLKIDIKN
jgi:hypothetical protein